MIIERNLSIWSHTEFFMFYLNWKFRVMKNLVVFGFLEFNFIGWLRIKKRWFKLVLKHDSAAWYRNCK